MTMSQQTFGKIIKAALVLLVIGGAVLLWSLPGGSHGGIGIIYKGTYPTSWPGDPRPLFIITNRSSYRIAWTMLAPEFLHGQEWTTVPIPTVRFGGETLAPHTTLEVYGIPATNVAYRYPVLWGLHPADALSRPKWKQAVDDWFERIRLRSPLLPHGIERSPAIPPHQASPDQADRQPLSFRERSEVCFSDFTAAVAHKERRATRQLIT